MKPIAALLALALLVRVIALRLFPFDGLYGQDAYAYFNYALGLKLSLLSGQGVPPFGWPIGYPLHIILSTFALGEQALAAQLVSVLAGSALAPLTYLLTREVWPTATSRRAGILAGLIVAFGGQALISSVSIMSDSTALAWATASAWLLLRYARSQRMLIFILSVMALCVSVLNRWAFGLLALPWVLMVLLTWCQHRSSIGWRRAIGLSAIAALLGAVIIGLALSDGSHAVDLQVVYWNPLNALLRQVENTDGVFDYALPTALYYAQPLLHPAYLFPLFVPLWIAGVWTLIRRKVRSAVVIIGWPLIVYVFLAGIAWQNPRFSLMLVPPLAVWVGIGFDRLWSSRRIWQWALNGVAVVALIGTLIWSARVTGNFIEQKNADLRVVQGVRAEVPADSTLLTFGMTATAQRYTDLRVIELYYLDEATLDRETQASGSHYLLIDVDNVERQWQGKAPAINYHWLQAHTRLTPIVSLPPYQLFRVD